MSSIVPKGFHATAHKVFSDFTPPVFTSPPAVPSSSAIKQLDCSICLENLQDPVTLVVCDHYFCFDCIKEWFKMNYSCPMCKSTDVSFIRNGATKDPNNVCFWRLVTKSRLEMGQNSDADSEVQLSKAFDSHKKRFLSPEDENTPNDDNLQTAQELTTTKIPSSLKSTRVASPSDIQSSDNVERKSKKHKKSH